MTNVVTMYKRNASEVVVQWSITEKTTFDGGHFLIIEYGLLGNVKVIDSFTPTRKNEFTSRINAKRKEGYKELSELYDNAPESLKGTPLVDYLNSYLPKYNTGASGEDKVMLASTFKYGTDLSNYIGQFKINGLRTYISCVPSNNMFAPYEFVFRSRIGTVWTMIEFNDYLVEHLPIELAKFMIDSGASIDGEFYIPGLSVNEINSAVKNRVNPNHYKLQLWCYDLMLEETKQWNRTEKLKSYIKPIVKDNEFISKADHLNNKERLVVLNNYEEFRFDDDAIRLRDKLIDYSGFEGAMFRNIENLYQFGRRNKTMIKFKRREDGKFLILDIIPEGDKRANLPKFICKNDITDGTFECNILGTFAQQEQYLINKDKYIGKYIKVEYGERSGVKSVPFHHKGINIIE